MPLFKKNKQYFSFLLKITLTAVLLFILFKKYPPSYIYSIFKSCPSVHFWLGFSMFFSLFFLGVLRWQVLLKGINISKPYWKIFFVYMKGMVFNVICPSVIAGDIYRAVALKTPESKTSSVMASVTIDRLSGFLALALIAFSGAVSTFFLLDENSKDASVLYIIIFLVVGFSLCLLFATVALFSKRVYSKVQSFISFIAGKLKGHYLSDKFLKITGVIDNFHDAILVYRGQKIVLLKAFIISFVLQLLIPIIFYIVALGLFKEWFKIGLVEEYSISFVFVIFVVPIINAIAMMPLTIGGVVVREVVSGKLLPYAIKAAGNLEKIADFFPPVIMETGSLEGAAAFIIAFIFSLSLFFAMLLGGIFYVSSLCFGWLQHNSSDPGSSE